MAAHTNLEFVARVHVYELMCDVGAEGSVIVGRIHLHVALPVAIRALGKGAGWRGMRHAGRRHDTYTIGDIFLLLTYFYSIQNTLLFTFI